VKDRFSPPGRLPLPHWVDAELESLARPSILLVEDDKDIRDLLVTLLQLAGYTPSACGSAEEGLEHLREQHFDLILTDYMLPNRSGGWLIEQAASEGLLDATPALLVTAHPHPTDLHGIEIIAKPFDLEQLVERIRRTLAAEGNGGAQPRRKRKAGKGQSSSSPADPPSTNGECPDPIELILYVSAQSPRSAAALQNIKKVLLRYKSSRVRLTVHDLSKDPSRGAADGIAFTPTLVKKSPGPRTFILGHITNPELLIEILDSCGES
jgi:two-component system response regulator GlrR